MARTVREIRRRQGWSQRELARRSGVGERTIARIESGDGHPRVDVLQQLAAAAGLDLVADVPPPPVGGDVRRHLRRSLTQRLHLALGGGGAPRPGRDPLAWQQLCRLTAAGRVVLHGDAALALWLPPTGPLQQVEVCLVPGDAPGRRRPPTPELVVLEDCRAHVPGLVQVSVACWSVHVEAPADLAVRQPAHRYPLLAVAALLHDEAARDGAGRRVRAHADPRHRSEAGEVFHTKRFGSRPMPDEADRRGWRLDDDASLRAWLQRYGYPV